MAITGDFLVATDSSGVCRRCFICAVLLAPSWGIGLAQRVDQFMGTRTLRPRDDGTSDPGGPFDEALDLFAAPTAH